MRTTAQHPGLPALSPWLLCLALAACSGRPAAVPTGDAANLEAGTDGPGVMDQNLDLKQKREQLIKPDIFIKKDIYKKPDIFIKKDFPVLDKGSPCGGPCPEYVFNRILLPLNATTNAAYALQFKGKSYNGLGSLLSLIAQQTLNQDYQADMDHAVCSGSSLHLLRVTTPSLTGASKVQGQIWPDSAACCTAKTCATASGACTAAATALCFNGKGAFTPLSGYTNLTQSGSIASSILSLGPGKAVINIPMILVGSAAAPLPLVLKGATIRGTISKSSIVKGVLAGGIDQAQVQTKLIPAWAKAMDQAYKSPSVDPKTKALLSQIMDTNKDGTITTQEVAQNPLLKTFLMGDADLDGDGVLELTFGVGFTAVPATIKAP